MEPTQVALQLCGIDGTSTCVWVPKQSAYHSQIVHDRLTGTSLSGTSTMRRSRSYSRCRYPTQPRPCRSSRQRFTIACTAGPPPRTICERRCMVSSEPQLLRVVCCRCLPPRVGPACGEIAVAVVRGRTRSRCLQGKRCCGCALRVSGRTVTTVVPPPPPGRVLPRKSTSCGIRARQ